ncbi:MAG TPA: SCO family protein [Planctomycetaceae bacterium]|nr:SCO family protein [Planctomycetaceae bacterium]
MSNTDSRLSLGAKLTYLVIVLLWLSAAGAVYVVFFAPGAAREREAASGEEKTPGSGGQKATLEHEQVAANVEAKVADSEEFKLPRELPEFELVNQSNEKVSRDSLKGKPWVATFVFSRCPGPCPMITGRMRVLQQDMKRYDVNLISITVDPERDTPEMLTKYAAAFSADLSNWNFLTGDRVAIYSLIRDGFKMPVGEIKPGDILHTNRFVLVDAKGFYVESFLAMEDEDFAKLKKRLRDLAPRKTDGESDSSDETSEPAEKPRDGE